MCERESDIEREKGEKTEMRETEREYTYMHICEYCELYVYMYIYLCVYVYI